MPSEGPKYDFAQITAPGTEPKIHSIFDFTAEALEQLAFWLEQRGLHIPIGQVLGYTRNQQTVKAGKSATQAIGTASLTVVTWDTEDYDLPDGGQHDTVTNNSRLTCIVPGRYQAFGYVAWAASALGNYRQVELFKNGATSLGVASQPPVGGGNATEQMPAFPPQDLVVGDYLEIRVAQDTGGNLNVGTASKFGMTRIA